MSTMKLSRQVRAALDLCRELALPDLCVQHGGKTVQIRSAGRLVLVVPIGSHGDGSVRNLKNNATYIRRFARENARESV